MWGEWMTREGKVIRISSMTNSHLQNTINMLERNVEAYRQEMAEELIRDISGIVGEMAEYQLEGELTYLANMSDEEFLSEFTSYDELVEEKERRLSNGEFFEIKKSESLVDKWLKMRERDEV